jgi:uncharacterized protein
VDADPPAWFEPEPAGDALPLRNVFLHVTKACNLRCRYCYFSARTPLPNELTAAEFDRLWPDFVAVRPEKVVFTGGEPLLRPDLLDLLRGLRDADPAHRVLRCLNTNGHLVTPALVRELVGLADEVRVSIDALADRNDRLRGRGNFDAAVRALDSFYEAGFEPKALVAVTAVGLPDLEDLLVFLFERRITRVNLNGFREVGRGEGHPDWRPNPGLIRAALRRAWARCYPGRPPPPEAEGPEEQSHCGVGRFLNVMPDGDVFPCHVLTAPEFRLGNLREQGLLEICRRGGLLGQLAGLDFRKVAGDDCRAAPLTRPGACLGDVYAAAPSLPAWRKALPLLPPA